MFDIFPYTFQSSKCETAWNINIRTYTKTNNELCTVILELHKYYIYYCALLVLLSNLLRGHYCILSMLLVLSSAALYRTVYIFCAFNLYPFWAISATPAGKVVFYRFSLLILLFLKQIFIQKSVAVRCI